MWPVPSNSIKNRNIFLFTSKGKNSLTDCLRPLDMNGNWNMKFNRKPQACYETSKILDSKW